MSLPLINFDDHFADFTSEWMREHKYRNYDAMEADLPRIYMAFLNKPATWLEGITPGAYFTQFEDAKDLVDWLNLYCDSGVPVPDLLQEQIVNVGKPCEKRLLELLKTPDASTEAKMTAIGLLRDLKSTLPKSLYITWQLNREDEDELKDNAIESLMEMGKSVIQPILQELPHANEAGQAAFMDVLVQFPGDQQIFNLAMKLFRNNPDKRALYAGYLGKLGDNRALPMLIEATKEANCTYLTYIEIRNAIEMLGGECPEREYESDPEYEALSGMDG